MGGRRRNWKTRWFVLQVDQMLCVRRGALCVCCLCRERAVSKRLCTDGVGAPSYFKSPSDAQPTGQILLADATISADYTKRPNWCVRCLAVTLCVCMIACRRLLQFVLAAC